MRSKIVVETISIVLIILGFVWYFLGYSYIYTIIYCVIGIVLLLICLYSYNKCYNITLNYLDPYIPWKSWYSQDKFLTEEEIIFYKTLYKVLHDEYGDRYHIFGQVELQQLFQKKKKAAFRINMSVDFLIVDFKNNLKPLIAVELDGDPHRENEKVKYNDMKKEHLFSLSKIKLVRIVDEDKDNKDKIYEEIIPILEAKNREK